MTESASEPREVSVPEDVPDDVPDFVVEMLSEDQFQEVALGDVDPTDLL